MVKPQIRKIEAKSGQESVWDYPRPPRLEPSNRHVRIIFAGETIAESSRCVRLLETSHPPNWYIPRSDVRTELLIPTGRTSFCEFKGSSTYYSVRHNNRTSPFAAWAYHDPTPAFSLIRDYLAFYANRVDACFVDDERVQAQSGDFYGGWITSEIVGPFKGGPGTYGW